MKKQLFFLVSLAFLTHISSMLGQNEKYSRIKIDLKTKSLRNLAELGVEADHGEIAIGKYIINEYAEHEIAKIKQAGFQYEVLIDDLKSYLREQNSKNLAHIRGGLVCDNTTTSIDSQWETPKNFKLGSMAGYYTYQELLDILAKMKALYPNLISDRKDVSTIKTIENRAIQWVKISDNPNQSESSEPQILYTAVHHAREPNGMSALIFYMWYLLEHYDTDPQIKYLLDNTELCFIPCVNPDGYIFNQTTDPQGGGFWRKNRRDNGDGTFGVDLNRNYGYQWGYDNTGSSIMTDSETYRGKAGFSEPETSAIKAFCEANHFKVALNFHTYGNLFIYPWGYSDAVADPALETIAKQLTRENKYTYGTGSQTVGYTVNGDSDDWMYGEKDTKSSILSFTPEATKGYGFWAPASEIAYFCKETMRMNLDAAWMLHNYISFKDQSSPYITSTTGQIEFKAQRLGLKDGPVLLSLSPLSNNIVQVGGAKILSLASLQEVNDSFSYKLSPTIAPDEEIVFLLTTDNGVVKTDTIRKRFLAYNTYINDKATNLDNWKPNTTTGWNTTTTTYKSAPSCFTDSPNGNYPINRRLVLTSKKSFYIPENAGTILRFWAKWDIEKGQDYAQAMVSSDGVFYSALCGKYTVLGTFDQLYNEPLYDGLQSDWVMEEIDLSDLGGTSLYLRFQLYSDQTINKDGMYLDDIELITSGKVVKIDELKAENLSYQIQPNPITNDEAILQVNNAEAMLPDAHLRVMDVAGKVIIEQELNLIQGKSQLRLSTQNWANGVYSYQIISNSHTFAAKKLVLAR
jgi:carboxypeptidase T